MITVKLNRNQLEVRCLMPELPSVTCPECGAPMVLRETTKYTYKNGNPRKFWGCSRYPECDATHGAHPDGQPLGIPADKETKRLRIMAHNAFDQWAEDAGFTRKQAYRRLSEHFSIKEAHIGEMNIEACKEVIRFVEGQYA